MKTVYVLFENDGNHDCFYDKNSRKDGYAIPFVYLREEIEKLGYQFKPTFDYKGLGSANDVAYIISITCLNQTILESVAKHPKERCFLLNLEPWTTHGVFYEEWMTNYFGKIFVMFDDMVDHKRFFKFYHPQCNEQLALDVPPFEQKKFCVMVQANHFVDHPKSEYGERRKAATFFTAAGEFDLYGARWDGYSSWKGAFRTGKVDLIKNYQFYLAYENMKDQRGYMTERLIEAFYAQCIPIYLGPSNITDYVPKECFINRTDFSSYEELYHFMKSIDRPRYDSYVQAGQEFLKSSQAEPFTTKNFAKTIIEQME